MTQEIFCPVHTEVRKDIERIEEVQRRRPCGENTEAINTLKSSDEKQWIKISRLERLVYIGAGGAGVLAFLGSLLGAFLRKA
jgi:hypothetical protein